MKSQTYILTSFFNKIVNRLVPKYLTNYLNTNDDPLFAIHDSAGAKLLSRLRLKFSHLNKHKFRHYFKDPLSPISDCDSKTDTTDHFFLRCPFLAIQTRTPIWLA